MASQHPQSLPNVPGLKETREATFSTMPLNDTTSSPSFPSNDHVHDVSIIHNNSTTTVPKKAGRREVILIFLCGIGCNVGWTAVLSNLVFYTMTLGMDSYLWLNLVVFAPILPITLAQVRWDSRFDRLYDSARAYRFRGHICFAVALAGALLLPFASQSLVRTCAVSLLLGSASAALQGTLKQLAAFIYPECGYLAASVTAGMQAAAICVLFTTVGTGFGASGSADGLGRFYTVVACWTGLSWMSFVLLMVRSEDIRTRLSERDTSMLSGFPAAASSSLSVGADSTVASFGVPLLADIEAEYEFDHGMNGDNSEYSHSTNSEVLRDTTPSPARIDGRQPSLITNHPASPSVSNELSSDELWRKTRPSCVAVILVVSSSMFVASWFNRVESQYAERMDLPQTLFYTRLLSDLLGRLVTVYLPLRSTSLLLFLSIVRLAVVPVFFMYISTDWIPRNDLAVIASVLLYAFGSGYLSTVCYQIAPLLLEPDERPVNVVQQAGIINVCFASAIFVGVSSSLLLREVGFRGDM